MGKTPEDLTQAGLMVKMTGQELRQLDGKLSGGLPLEGLEVVSKAPDVPGCLTLDFRGVKDASAVKSTVEAAKKLLPEAIIAGVGLHDHAMADAFGCAGGEFYTYATLPTSGQFRKAWPLPYAYGPSGLGIGCHRLYPHSGIDMLQAVTHWSADFGCTFIACFVGQDQFRQLYRTDLAAELAKAGAVAIEVSLADAEAVIGTNPATQQGILGVLAEIRRGFLNNVRK